MDERVEGAVKAFEKAKNRLTETTKDLKEALRVAKKEKSLTPKEAQSVDRLLRG